MPGFDQRDRVATKGSRHNSPQGQAFKPGNLRVATNADGTLASRAESAQFGIHVARIAAYVRLRPRMQRYSRPATRLPHLSPGSGPGLGSVLVSFIPVRGRSPVDTRIVFAQFADCGGRR